MLFGLLEATPVSAGKERRAQAFSGLVIFLFFAFFFSSFLFLFLFSSFFPCDSLYMRRSSSSCRSIALPLLLASLALRSALSLARASALFICCFNIANGTLLSPLLLLVIFPVCFRWRQRAWARCRSSSSESASLSFPRSSSSSSLLSHRSIPLPTFIPSPLPPAPVALAPNPPFPPYGLLPPPLLSLTWSTWPSTRVRCDSGRGHCGRGRCLSRHEYDCDHGRGRRIRVRRGR